MQRKAISNAWSLFPWILVCGATLGAIPGVTQSRHASDIHLNNRNESITVHVSDGSYEIADENNRRSILHARVAAKVDHSWVTSSEYPVHQTSERPFTDALGSGHEIEVQCKGLPARPDLVYTIRLYDTLPWGDIQVQVQNHTAQPETVQMVRSVEGVGDAPIHTGVTETEDRVLSDSFSEDWPPLKIRDLRQAPDGMLRAVGSQLIYNRKSRESLFFGALTSERLLTILHLHVNPRAAQSNEISYYTVDSTGTTEIQASDPESGLRGAPAKNLIELNLPLPAGATVHSELLMFAVGSDYFSILDHYGSAIRTLHHARVSSPGLLGWWSWTAFYSDITQGNTWTNAQWLSKHLKNLGYDYFHLDLGYAYARGEYATPNAAQFPDGLAPLSHKVCSLGLKMGLWTAPFEVSDRSWVYEHHKDWLVHNSQGEPIWIGVGDEAGKEDLFVLDATNPAAQQYLRQTYRTLVQDWGARYIKLDFMDNTAIEGYYYRPHTTALEAQRIGLHVIRDVVGENVLLDKDGSPMLNPVGLVDEGRLSQDTGHLFERSKEAAPGIAARYYMNRNFFISDSDGFTVSRQMIEERHIQAPLALNEAKVSITLAAVAGGMFEIGDDLPTLGADPDRVALVKNPDLLQMIKLGRAAVPLDLLTYRTQDEQPSIFLLREDRRQRMLAVFNWTKHPRSHAFQLADLDLSPGHQYQWIDVFQPEQHLSTRQGALAIEDQPAHSVRLIKIIDETIPASAPSVNASAPEKGLVGENLQFSSVASSDGVPAVAYRWDFDDGTGTQGAIVSHTYTRADTYNAHLQVKGVDGVAYQQSFSIVIQGTVKTPAPRRYVAGHP